MPRRSNIAPTDGRTKDVGLGLYIGPWQEFKLAKFREEALKQFREEWQQKLSERLDDVDVAHLNDALGPLLTGLPINEIVTLRDLKTTKRSRHKNPGREGSGGSTISAPAATGGPRPIHREDPNAALSDAGDIRAFSSKMQIADAQKDDRALQAKQRLERKGIVNRKPPSISGRSAKSSSSSVSSSRTGVYSSGSSEQSSKASNSDAPKKVQTSVKWSSVPKKKKPAAKSTIHNGTDSKKAAMVLKMVRRKDANHKRPPRPQKQKTAAERNVSHINKMRKMYSKGIRESNGESDGAKEEEIVVAEGAASAPSYAPQQEPEAPFITANVSVAFPADDDDLESVASDDLDGAVDDLINWTDGLDIDAMDDEFNFAF
jgi:hypothetical protein